MKDQVNEDTPAISKGSLFDLLTSQFLEEDARQLIYFFQHHADAQCFSYQDLQFPTEDAQDLLLLCFD